MTDGLKADLIRARDLMTAWQSGRVSHGTARPDYSYKEWCEKIATILPHLIATSTALAGVPDPARQVERWKAMEMTEWTPEQLAGLTHQVAIERLQAATAEVERLQARVAWLERDRDSACDAYDACDKARTLLRAQMVTLEELLRNIVACIRAELEGKRDG